MGCFQSRQDAYRCSEDIDCVSKFVAADDSEPRCSTAKDCVADAHPPSPDDVALLALQKVEQLGWRIAMAEAIFWSNKVYPGNKRMSIRGTDVFAFLVSSMPLVIDPAPLLRHAEFWGQEECVAILRDSGFAA